VVLVLSNIEAKTENNMATPNINQIHHGTWEYTISKIMPVMNNINPMIDKITANNAECGENANKILLIMEKKIAKPKITQTHDGSVEYLITNIIPIIIRTRAIRAIIIYNTNQNV
jgi:hypothetical protein